MKRIMNFVDTHKNTCVVSIYAVTAGVIIGMYNKFLKKLDKDVNEYFVEDEELEDTDEESGV